MSQVLVDGLTITVVGVTLVFVVLVVLSYCFGAMKFLASNEKTKKKGTADIPSVSTTGSADDGAAELPEGEGGPAGDELAVVITVALAAFMGDEHVITSMRRIEDTGAWSRTGRHDQMVFALN